MPSLVALAGTGAVKFVVAQPDRPKGRGRPLAAPPVKQCALDLGLGCMQTERPNAPGAIGALEGLAPDLFVVVAFGAILSPELLAVPRLGSINLHASLLPEYRGASPIQAALLDGRNETGNTTLWIDEGLDSGDMILRRALAIGPDETAGGLSARLAQDGAVLLAETIERVARGDAPRTSQDPARATMTKKVRKVDGLLDFKKPAREVHDRARAMTPWPGAIAGFAGQPVRFERTRLWASGAGEVGGAGGERDAERVRAASGATDPGAILGPGPSGGLVVACGEGAIEEMRVRPAGRNEMDAQAWWLGLRSGTGATACFSTLRPEELS